MTFCILPLLVIMFLYISCTIYHIYVNRRDILEDVREELYEKHWAKACRKLTAAFWYATSRIWNGYEVVIHEDAKRILQKNSSQQMSSNSHSQNSSPDNTQNNIPTMIVYYHGAIPLDLYYFIMYHALDHSARSIYPCVDRFMFKVPGFSSALRFWNCIPGPRDKIIESLVNGNIVALSPGGTREAIFSQNYQLLWGKRYGWADCLLSVQRRLETQAEHDSTIQTKVCVLPMFTKNSRSMFDYPIFVKRWKVIRWFYETFRWPIYPMFGGFPVKMTTFIGEPIFIDKSHNSIELSKEIQRKLKGLIRKYQNVDTDTAEEKRGIVKNTISALIQRFQKVIKKD